MHLKIYTLISQLILYFFYQYSAVNAIIGQDVKQANLRDFPFAVVIMRIDNEQQVRKPYQTCTGSLISIRDVVTAAHCLDLDTLHLMQILVGSVDLSIGKRYFAAWWIVYNEWALYNNIIPEFPENDIGIIRLTRDVTEDLTPAVISFAPYIYTYPLTVTIAGWGKPSEDGESMMLTTVKLKTIQGSECEERLLNMYDLKVIADKRFLCSIGEPYALVTIGDSGGPVMYNNKLIAIILGTCPHRANDSGKINLLIAFHLYKEFIESVLNR